MTLKLGSLFSGTTALDLAAADVFRVEPAWFSDIDPGACALLAHHYPDVPNLGDISAVDWDQVEPVWALTGGFPCTDVSGAGKKAGLKPDTRSGLWNQMAYAISKLRPQVVLIENVRGLASAEAHSDLEPCPWCLGDQRNEPALRALGAVLGDLANIGYDAVWRGLPASDIGACHARFRFFILAYAADAEDERHERPRPARRRRAGSPDRGVDAANAAGEGLERPEPEPSAGVLGRRDIAPADSNDAGSQGTEPAGRRNLPTWGVATDTDSNAVREQPERIPWSSDTTVAEQSGAATVDWGPYGSAVERWSAVLGRPAPIPTLLSEQYLKRLARHQESVRRRLARLDPRPVGMRGSLLPPKETRVLNPALPEWMMGLPDGWITDVPGLTRAQQLKLAGNGVVRQQAVYALKLLLADAQAIQADRLAEAA